MKNIEQKDIRNEIIDEIGKGIRIYNSRIKTGDDVLDVILMQKNMICENNGIKLGCIIEGAALDFMEANDRIALFGNALDNAVEYLKNNAEPAHRLISVMVSVKGQMVYVHFENYCNTELTFAGGIPVTTKEDTNYHGFGLKSIRYIVRKYEGECNIYQERETFNIDMIFPRADIPFKT